MKRNLTNSKAPHQRGLYTIGEAAEFLGVSVNTVKEWRKKGKFPPSVRTSPQGWDLWTPNQLRGIAVRISGKKS